MKPKPASPTRRQTSPTSETELTDSETLVTEYHDATADFLALSITTVIDITDDDATCMANTLLESLGPEALGRLTDTQSTDAFGLEVMRVASDCGVPLDTFAPQPGITYGDNPTMDALYDECAAGSGAACDALYQQSGVRTEYESFGLTCGNRFGARDAYPCARATSDVTIMSSRDRSRWRAPSDRPPE